MQQLTTRKQVKFKPIQDFKYGRTKLTISFHKDRTDPCKVDSDCEPGLICENNQVCGCLLGHFGGACLQSVTKEEEECHVDDQCYELFGNHSVCHYNTERSRSQCECAEKYKLVSDEGASKKCRLTCEKDEDCSGSEAGAGQSQECVHKGADNEVTSLGVCQAQARKGEDDNGTSKPEKSGMSAGGVIGIIFLVVVIALLLGAAFYHRRPLLQRFGC